MNIAYLAERAEGVLLVFAAPHFVVDWPRAYEQSVLKHCVDRIGELFGDLWDVIAAFGVKAVNDACPKAVATLQEKEGIDPRIAAKAESVCQDPKSPVDAFIAVCGLFFLLFLFVFRPVLSAFLFGPPKTATATHVEGIKKKPSFPGVAKVKSEINGAIEKPKNGSIQNGKKKT